MSREDDEQFKQWTRAVKCRDNYSCQICGANGGGVYLEAHHKNSWNAFPDERYLLSNGASLCRTCHIRFHDAYGYGNNTEFQYKQYEDTAELLKKVAQMNAEKDGGSRGPTGE